MKQVKTKNNLLKNQDYRKSCETVGIFELRVGIWTDFLTEFASVRIDSVEFCK